MTCAARFPLPLVCPISRKLRIHSLQLVAILAGFALFATDSSRSQSLTSEEGVTASRTVREFMQTVSRSVTQDGPLAWIQYFEAGPTFFMAVNGQMAFPDGASAQDGTRKFAKTIRRIELIWGNDLRIDPLTNNLAAVASSWREIQVDVEGHTVKETGYFTGLAEYRNGHWQFRNAHWSAPVSSH